MGRPISVEGRSFAAGYLLGYPDCIFLQAVLQDFYTYTDTSALADAWGKIILAAPAGKETVTLKAFGQAGEA
jgi:hypothetical protein